MKINYYFCKLIGTGSPLCDDVPNSYSCFDNKETK